MSIAVSAVIHPSRLLRASLAACAAVHLGASLALAGAAAGPAAGLPALACALCALLLARQARQGPNVRRIDISGLGEIRLTVQQEASGTGPLALCPGSTLWPRLLLLRLRPREGGGRRWHWRCCPTAWRPALSGHWRSPCGMLPSATINFSETTKYFELIATGQLLYIGRGPGQRIKAGDNRTRG